MGGLRRWATIAVLVPVLFGSACAIGAKSSAGALPPSPPTVRVGMAEYSFEFDHDIPAGRVVFDVVNNGTIDHSMTVLKLPEDLPPLLDQLRGDERRGLSALARVPALAPGQHSTFAVDLTPGRYGMICFVTDPDGMSHAVKGQATEFRVT